MQIKGSKGKKSRGGEREEGGEIRRGKAQKLRKEGGKERRTEENDTGAGRGSDIIGKETRTQGKEMYVRRREVT